MSRFHNPAYHSYNISMQPTVVQKLLELNNQFYQTFGKAFSITRQRIQPGIACLLEQFNTPGAWLDLGCGSGVVAKAWAETPGRTGAYLGVDFSPVLLDEARAAVGDAGSQGLDIQFSQADLTDPKWWGSLRSRSPEGRQFDVISAFAVLHHIPSSHLRRQLIASVHAHLKPGGVFMHSVWQFQHSAKLMARRQPWSAVGLTPAQLEEGDVLLDWRFALPGQAEQTGLRYVHLFSREELRLLAAAGFEIQQTFESDGEGSRLGLYQIWKKYSKHPLALK